MKTTPFQQALKNELYRLEHLTQYSNENQMLIAFRNTRPTKNKHFLLQFFRLRLSL
jgi:hypothetical protein